MDVTEIIPAADLRQTPPPFVASQSGAVNAPTANEEAQLRALFQDASAKGMDLGDSVPAPQAMPAPVVAAPPSVSVPEKFKTPEGTVDEDKLKASSKLLDGAIEEKTKSIDEMMADYKERERKLHELSQQKAELGRQMPVVPPVNVQNVNPNDPQMVQLHQQILADMQRDPVNTSIMLNRALVQKELEPVLRRFQQEEEIRQDSLRRDSFTRLAESDPRVMQNQYYQAINQVLDEDPAMMRLKNPHKAAWNEVKERLRLGEPIGVQAQPSISAPALGRGAPPSVSTFQGSVTPQSLSQEANQLNPYSDAGKAYEEKLRQATAGLWQ